MLLSSIDTVVMIGSGNVATHFSKAIINAGIKIIQIYSKHPESARQLSTETGAEFVSSAQELSAHASLYILAVNDNAIEKVASEIKTEKKLVVHTSGSVPADVLKIASPHYGVIYPLQTFSMNSAILWKEIPMFIEASSPELEKLLIHFALLFSEKVYPLASEKRKYLHLAAVFANNFVNYLYAVSYHIVSKQQLPFDYVKPLIIETAKRVTENYPTDLQTGPAKRADIKIIIEHMDMLAQNK